MTMAVELLVAFNLLDRQIVDRDGLPVGKVDDVELDRAEDGGLYVATLLTGLEALGPRVGGALGRWMAAAAGRVQLERQGPRRIPYDLVASVESAVVLSVKRDLLPEPELETWLNQHLIGRIPGAEHAGG
jgi:sporulation protein YlmC with PRC-barrel domain